MKFFKTVSIMLFMLFCLSPGFSLSKNLDQSKQNDNVKVQYDYLINDVKEYRSFIEKERSEYQKFMENLYNKTLCAFSIIMGLFGFIGFASYKATLEEIKASVDKEIRKKAEVFIDEATEEINTNIKKVEKEIAPLISYKNSKIFVLNSNPEGDIGATIEILKEKGVKNIQLQKDIRGLNKGYCLAIFDLERIHEDEEINKRLKEYILYLKENSLNIPFIIYTKGRIDYKIPDSCDNYYICANNRSTLVLHTFSMLKIFC